MKVINLKSTFCDRPPSLQINDPFLRISLAVFVAVQRKNRSKTQIKIKDDQIATRELN